MICIFKSYVHYYVLLLLLKTRNQLKKNIEKGPVKSSIWVIRIME